jgi:hypothetical protein
VQLSGPRAARGHLRLATAPARPSVESRAVLIIRAVIASVLVAWRSAAAFIGAVLALAPLVWRRAPVGRRARAMAPRQARVIPFQPRRRSQQALPR